MDITISLTEAELKALSADIVNVQEWAQYIIKDRARIEMDKIIDNVVKNCLNNNINLPSGSKEEIILSTPLETAYEKHQQLLQSLQNNI